MTFDEYKQIIDYFGRKTRLLYLSCRYEPFMTPDMEKYIAYAKNIGIPFVSLCSNMMLINDKIVKCLVDQKIDEIILSINGYSEENYNRIMYKSNYQIVMNNLKKITDYKKQMNSKYPKIRINTILMKSNILEFDKLIEIVHEYDVDLIRFIPLREHDYPNDPNESKKEEISNIPTDILDKVKSNIISMINELKQEGISVTIPASFINTGASTEKRKINNKSCCFPYYHYGIRHNGEVEACIRDPRGIMGNFFTDDIKTMMKNRSIFRKMALTGKCNIDVCATNTEIPDVI